MVTMNITHYLVTGDSQTGTTIRGNYEQLFMVTMNITRYSVTGDSWTTTFCDIWVSE